jgi:hypothetical protein
VNKKGSGGGRNTARARQVRSRTPGAAVPSGSATDSRKGRPTLYRGILMRSRLEADFAAHLDQAGTEWEYEPVCFAGPGGQWLPDFGVIEAGRVHYVEVKPPAVMRGRGGKITDPVDAVLRQMEVAWLTDATLHLQLVLWTYHRPDRSTFIIGMPPDTDGVRWWYPNGNADNLQMWLGMGQPERVLARAFGDPE